MLSACLYPFFILLIHVFFCSLEFIACSFFESALALKPSVAPTMPIVLIDHLDAPIETSTAAIVDVLLEVILYVNNIYHAFLSFA